MKEKERVYMKRSQFFRRLALAVNSYVTMCQTHPIRPIPSEKITEFSRNAVRGSFSGHITETTIERLAMNVCKMTNGSHDQLEAAAEREDAWEVFEQNGLGDKPKDPYEPERFPEQIK